MYTDLIDSVRNTKSNEVSFIKAETFLFYSLLNGHRPTLTLTQAIDSAVILSIAQNPEQGSCFIKAIENGYIRISLYGQVSSLQGHLLSTLKRNTNSDSNKFIFSSMPFLYEGDYTDKQRRAIFSELIRQIQEGNPAFAGPVLDKEHKNFIEEYVETIRRINNAARSAYILPSNSVKELKDVIRLRVDERLRNTADNESLKTLLIHIGNSCTSNFRTFYYDILKKSADSYDPSIIKEVKELIDYCYNEVVASSINDNEPANLNIPNTFPELAAAAAGFSNTEKMSKNEITVSDKNKEYLTWERLLNVMKDIEDIRQSKKCGWNEALGVYTARQHRLPFMLGTKYAGVTALTLAVSSVPVLGSLVSNFVTELLWSSVCDAFGEVMKKPSFNDILKTSRESEKRCRLLNLAVSQTSLNVNSGI